MNIKIGTNKNTGDCIKLSQEARTEGVAIIGPKGSGKFSLSVLPMIQQDIESDKRVVYFGECEEFCELIIDLADENDKDFIYINLNGNGKNIIKEDFFEIEVSEDITNKKVIVINFAENDELSIRLLNNMVYSLLAAIDSNANAGDTNMYFDSTSKYISNYVIDKISEYNSAKKSRAVGVHIIEDSYTSNNANNILKECNNVILYPGCEKEDVKMFDLLSTFFLEKIKKELGDLRFSEFKTAAVLSLKDQTLMATKMNVDFIN